jgi:hypothetical protein
MSIQLPVPIQGNAYIEAKEALVVATSGTARVDYTLIILERKYTFKVSRKRADFSIRAGVV